MPCHLIHVLWCKRLGKVSNFTGSNAVFLPRERIFVFWLLSRIKFCFKPRRKLNGSQETLLSSFLWLDVSSNKYRKLAFLNFSLSLRYPSRPLSPPPLDWWNWIRSWTFIATQFRVASHADVLRGSSRVPAPLTSGAGTRDEPLPLAKQSTGYAFTNGYKNFLNESGDECCKSSSRLSIRKSFIRFNNGAKLFERMLIIDLFTVYDAILAGGKHG